MARLNYITIMFPLALSGLLLAGCSSKTAPSNAPGSHTSKIGGVYHLPGFTDPNEHCVACHGANLEGGTNDEPSCTSCHDQLW